MINANNDFELNKDNWKDYQKDLANTYFPKEEDAPKLTGISIKNDISKAFEDETIVKEYLKKGEINETVVAWKAGRLEENEEEKGNYSPQKKDGSYLNGYGKAINIRQLNNYLKTVNKKWDKLKLDQYKIDDFKEVYKPLIFSIPQKGNKEENRIVPENFGSVYIINLIYFKSKGSFPIYDKFAHKALKALYMNKLPHEIFVGDAPGKYEVNKAVNMYQEYLWLLGEVFSNEIKKKKNEGMYISRELDRALWVYGHAAESFSIEELKKYKKEKENSGQNG